MIGPSKLPQVGCEPSLILIQVFIAVIRGKDQLLTDLKGLPIFA